MAFAITNGKGKTLANRAVEPVILSAQSASLLLPLASSAGAISRAAEVLPP